MEKARAKEQAKDLAYEKKGAMQVLTKVGTAIAALEAMLGRRDIELIARPLVVLRQRQSPHTH